MEFKPKHIYIFACVLALFCVVFVVFRINVNAPAPKATAEILQNSQSTEPVPTVLGVATDLRGQPTPAAPAPKKIKDLNITGVTAQSFLAFELDTGAVLAEKNGLRQFPIASITKLVTALVTYRLSDVNSIISVKPDDVLQVEPSLKLEPDDKVSALDLLKAMIVGSANDAALTLSHFVASVTGKSFTELMNQQAAELKMDDSRFSNPMGFDSPDNYSTAEDLQKLVTAIEQYSWFNSLGKTGVYKFTSETGKNFKIQATNKLIGPNEDIEAVKTGYTESAGGAMISKVNFNSKKIIIIVLESANREQDTLKIKNALQDSYQWQ